MTEEEKKKAEEAAKAAEAKKKEEEKKDDEFAKQGEQVDANKHNQAIRKAREAEAEKRELEEENKKLREAFKNQKPIDPIPPKKDDDGGDDDDDDDDFWGEKKKEKKKETPTQDDNQKLDPEYVKSIIDEQIRPYVESENQRTKLEKKKARQDFYDAHPEYLEDNDKWAELLDELGSSIVPSGDYYQDLEKAHRIIGGESVAQVQIEKKQTEIANDAGTGEGGGNNSGGGSGDDLSEIDKKIMEGTGVDKEVIKKMRQMQKDGNLSLEW